MAQHQLGELEPDRKFIDNVQWGQGVGSIRLRFGTKFYVIIERMNYDLKGQPVWLTKKTFNMNREWFAGKEEVIAEELLKELNKIIGGPLDAPIDNYSDLERLVTTIAQRTSAVVNDPLYFDEIRKLNDHEYILKFDVRGHGLQAPNQRRVEQVMNHLR